MLPLLVSILVFSVVLDFLSFNNHALNIFENQKLTYDFYDIYYSRFHPKNKTESSEIILVDCGLADRAKMAHLIDTLASMKPKVIGVDVLFEGKKEKFSDSLLTEVIAARKDVLVLAAQDSTYVDKNSLTLPEDVSKGDISWPTNDNFTIRAIKPFSKSETDRTIDLAFSTIILEKYAPEKYNFLRKKFKDDELTYINYSYSTVNRNNQDDKYQDTYQAWDIDSMSRDSMFYKLVEDKIVLIGFLGTGQSNSVLDKHYTPFNEAYMGRSLPDMYGLQIHANILSMYLEGSFIHILSKWWTLFITALIVLANIFLYKKVTASKLLFQDLILRGIQLLEFFLFSIFMLFIYGYSVDNGLRIVRLDYSVIVISILLFVDGCKFYFEKVIPFFYTKQLKN